MSMIDHVVLSVRDYARSKAFYDAALAPLGMKCCMEFGKGGGYGKGNKPDFWIGEGQASYQTPEQLAAITPVHVAFVAASQAEVDAFHAAALAAGAKDHGKPGLRPEYHAKYYGAFALDPDGHNVEAVFHGS